MVKDERGDILVDPQKVLNRWKNYLCQVLNMQGAGGVRLKFMQQSHLCQSLKSPGSDQISSELIQAGREILHSEICKLIMLIWNKEELPHQQKESVAILVHKKGDKTD
jgi:hypothetical protein